MVKDFLQSDHKSVTNSEEVEEDGVTSDSEKRDRDITDWIVEPYKPPSSSKNEKAEGKEEDVSATQASTGDKSSI